MNIKIKVVSLLLSVVIAAGMFGGCSKVGGVNTDDYSQVAVATYGDEKIYLDEVNFFARNSQYIYEAYYGTDIWSNENYANLPKYVLQNAMSTVYQTTVLADKAAEMGITLSEEDKNKVNESVKKFFDEADENLIKACDISEERLTEIYEKNALANLVYETTYEGKDCSVAEDEAAQRTVNYILVPASEGEDKAKEVLAKVSEGADMKETAEEYSFSYSTLTFGDSDYDNEIGTVSAGMEEGDYAIAEVSSDGWYVMYMADKFDETATANKKASLEKEKKENYFKEQYAEWLKDSPKFKVDEDILGLITFTKSIYTAPETQADTSASADGETSAETQADTSEE